MNRYTIYCTEEQTKKALELGAPLQKTVCYVNNHCPELTLRVENGNEFHGVKEAFLYKFPTAEQMIGWLEWQEIVVETVKCETHWFARAYNDENTFFNKGRFVSRKEATLAAIDVALEHLKNNRK